MTKNDRANFGSKLGVILASAGSAVGLGNIWRFPYETGNHGGAAFIIIYLGCILLLGMPIMVSEFLIGRHSYGKSLSEVSSGHSLALGGPDGCTGGISYSQLLFGSSRLDT